MPALREITARRTCTKCNVEQDISEFDLRKNRGNRPDGKCKKCRRAYVREQWPKKKASGWLNPARKYARELKESTPCKDCGKYYGYWIMEFDHLRDKYKNINKLYGKPLKFIKEEIAKCEIVCANCHADRTYRRSISNGKDDKK